MWQVYLYKKCLFPRNWYSYHLGKPELPQLPTTKEDGLEVCLSDSVGHGSLYMFDIMGFKKDWLQKPIHSWKNDENYLEMEYFVQNMLVCNDPAERGVKLVSDFIDCLTKDSAEREDLLQVVEAHRKMFTDTNKSTMSSEFSV